MCGIAGFIHFKDTHINAEKALSAMANALAHRGPDDEGLWFDETRKCGLAHRRLSILDLSPSAHQPMHSATGRFTLIFNGEIYNHHDLRKTLAEKGANFQSTGDAETLLQSIEHFGLFHTLHMLNGMFAFALYDQKDKILTLVRDRLGVKPLYYHFTDDAFVFASELKGVMVHPQSSKTINPEALSAYFDYGFMPEPQTIYKNIAKLEAGTILQISLKGQLRKQKFWDLQSVTQKAFTNRSKETYTAKELFDHTHTLLRDAVHIRMTSSDVPVSSFLSGGIDSSLITALMQNMSNAAIDTFSLGFKQKSHDESAFAKAIAGHLKTKHHAFTMGPQDALRIAQKISDVYDEPFADSSALATLFLSEQTSAHVKVALTGDGGDELFQGYHRHIWADILKEKWFKKSPLMKSSAAGLLRFLSKDFLTAPTKLLPKSYRPLHLQEKLLKLAKVIGLSDPYLIYNALLKIGHGHNLVKNHLPYALPNLQNFEHPDELFQALDMLFYLPGDILTKVDRATMAFGLEARSPFLDYRLLEFSWHIPRIYKNQGGKGKFILRQMLGLYTPPKLFNRPKSGFALPLENLLRHDLKPWADQFMSLDALKKSDLLDESVIYPMWTQFQKGKNGHHHALWSVLMFQAFYERHLR